MSRRLAWRTGAWFALAVVALLVPAGVECCTGNPAYLQQIVDLHIQSGRNRQHRGPEQRDVCRHQGCHRVARRRTMGVKLGSPRLRDAYRDANRAFHRAPLSGS